jgi:hypothetical protein
MTLCFIRYFPSTCLADIVKQLLVSAIRPPMLALNSAIGA